MKFSLESWIYQAGYLEFHWWQWKPSQRDANLLWLDFIQNYNNGLIDQIYLRYQLWQITRMREMMATTVSAPFKMISLLISLELSPARISFSEVKVIISNYNCRSWVEVFQVFRPIRIENLFDFEIFQLQNKRQISIGCLNFSTHNGYNIGHIGVAEPHSGCHSGRTWRRFQGRGRWQSASQDTFHSASLLWHHHRHTLYRHHLLLLPVQIVNTILVK